MELADWILIIATLIIVALPDKYGSSNNVEKQGKDQRNISK